MRPIYFMTFPCAFSYRRFLEHLEDSSICCSHYMQIADVIGTESQIVISQSCIRILEQIGTNNIYGWVYRVIRN